MVYVVWWLIPGENRPRFIAHVVQKRVVIVFAQSIQIVSW